MSNKSKARVLLMLAVGIVFVFKNYVIVIGQTAKPVLVALNKADSTLAIIDPSDMKIIAKVPTGDSPHEVVLSADGKTAFVANYGAQTPGSSLSVIDVIAAKELRRADLSPLMRPHGLQIIGGKVYFTAETNRLIARYDPVSNKVDWIMGTGQSGSHMVVGTGDQNAFTPPISVQTALPHSIFKTSRLLDPRSSIFPSASSPRRSIYRRTAEKCGRA